MKRYRTFRWVMTDLVKPSKGYEREGAELFIYVTSNMITVSDDNAGLEEPSTYFPRLELYKALPLVKYRMNLPRGARLADSPLGTYVDMEQE